MRRPTPDPVGPGQESVWDYPRPPRVEATHRHVVVTFDGETIVDTHRQLRVLETSHPPVYYVLFEDVADGILRPSARRTLCEYKGRAAHHDVVGPSGRTERAAAWSYPRPAPGFEDLRDHVALYPGRMDRITVDDEVVRAVQGDFYGGWLTDEVVGPFKGQAPNSQRW